MAALIDREGVSFGERGICGHGSCKVRPGPPQPGNPSKLCAPPLRAPHSSQHALARSCRMASPGRSMMMPAGAGTSFYTHALMLFFSFHLTNCCCPPTTVAPGQGLPFGIVPRLSPVMKPVNQPAPSVKSRGPPNGSAGVGIFFEQEVRCGDVHLF
jgi:hypothetical protein